MTSIARRARSSIRLQARPPSFFTGLVSIELTVLNESDITSTGGNYLLNVGPTGKGEIIQAQQVPLRQTGAWLNKHGHAIYNTVGLYSRHA